MRNEVSYREIRVYLLGELTPDQVKDFETLMADDPELAKEVEVYRKLIPALDRLNERGLQANFQKWKTELAAENKTTHNKWSRWLYITAALGITLLGLLYFVSRKPADAPTINRDRPVDSLRQMPSAHPPNSLRQLNQAPPVADAPTKKGNQIRITAARELAQQQIAGLIPAVPMVRGQKPDDKWKPTAREVDSLIAYQNYSEAWHLLNTNPGIPDAHRLPRQAFLHLKLDNYLAALDIYRNYLKTLGDPNDEDWGLALVYLAAYPDRQADFWKMIDTIRSAPRHKYHADIEKLVSELRTVGIER